MLADAFRRSILIGLMSLVLPLMSAADIVKTTDPAVAAAFMAGAALENFDDLTAFSLSSYAAGQTIPASANFNTRNGLTAPTFNSGGGSFNDPIGNPGTPIGIFDPTGAIGADFISPNNVAGPTEVSDASSPFNNGFLEVFFVDEVSRVGFWVTHGGVSLTLLDDTANGFSTGDFAATAIAGEFVGIDRGAGEIKIATLIPDGSDAFTIDDLVWSEASLIEPPNQRLAWFGSARNLVAGTMDLDRPNAVASSPDGRNVYALGSGDDALVVFTRNAHTGALTFLESHRDGQGGVDGLAFGYNVAVSPDGANVYVTSSGDNSLAGFSRDPSDGSLTFLELFQEGVGGVSGIDEPFDLEISPDGRNIYVAGHNSQAVAIFDRDPQTGRLQFQSALSQEIQNQGVLPEHACMSPDGRHLYLASFFDNVMVFARDSESGALAFVELEDFDAHTGDCAVSPDGRFVYVPGASVPGQGSPVEILSRNSLTGEISPVATSEPTGGFISRLRMSPSGENLYVSSNALVHFERDAETGGLRLIETMSEGVGGVLGIQGVGAGTPVAPSPDGRHVYVSGASVDSIAAFSTSVFRPADVVQEGVDGVAEVLRQPRAMVLSEDSRFVYVADWLSDTIGVFEIDHQEDRLLFVERKKLGEVEDANGMTISGLDGLSDLVLSPNEDQLYAMGAADASIVIFDRELDGSLTYREAVFHPDVSSLLLTESIVVSEDGMHLYVTNSELGIWIAFARAIDGSLTHLPLVPTDLPMNPLGLAMTPDDGFVMIAETGLDGSAALAAYRRKGSGELVLVDRIGALSPGDPASRASDVRVSGDGRFVYMTVFFVGSPPLFDAGGIFVAEWDVATETLMPVWFVANDGDGAIDALGGSVGLDLSFDDEWVVGAGLFSDGFALFARDVETGLLHLAQKELASTQPEDLGLLSALRPEFTPDGRYLLVIGAKSEEGTLSLFVPEPGLGAGLAAGLLGLLVASGTQRRSRRRLSRRSRG